jgi:hypothetical protein
MSLIASAMEKTYIMDKTTTKDSYGSVKTVWKEGAEILVAYAMDSSTESRIASQQGVTNRFTLYTKRSVVLRFPDVIKRDSDGKYFRITSDGDDKRTPNSAGLDLRAVEAQEWEISQDE